jgi:hypothetical protein
MTMDEIFEKIKAHNEAMKSRTVDAAFEVLRKAGWTFTEAREVLLVPTNAVVGIISQPSCCTKEQG